VWQALLITQSNPEFTSAGGVLTFFWDFPTLAAVGCLVAVGFICTALHAEARTLSLGGLAALPLLTITLLELPRFFYPGLGRAFPAIVVVLILLHRYGRR
jgi:lipopolysaccharide export LptBFGC system permease protein LptF